MKRKINYYSQVAIDILYMKRKNNYYSQVAIDILYMKRKINYYSQVAIDILYMKRKINYYSQVAIDILYMKRKVQKSSRKKEKKGLFFFADGGEARVVDDGVVHFLVALVGHDFELEGSVGEDGDAELVLVDFFLALGFFIFGDFFAFFAEVVFEGLELGLFIFEALLDNICARHESFKELFHDFGLDFLRLFFGEDPALSLFGFDGKVDGVGLLGFGAELFFLELSFFEAVTGLVVETFFKEEVGFFIEGLFVLLSVVLLGGELAMADLFQIIEFGVFHDLDRVSEFFFTGGIGEFSAAEDGVAVVIFDDRRDVVIAHVITDEDLFKR